MSTREVSNSVNRGDVPPGYTVFYHELRGYDSPDKWYTANVIGGGLLGEYGSYEDAVKACNRHKGL